MQQADTIRLDKWLWHARFVKSRTLATKLISSSGVRVDGVRVSKPSHSVTIGNVLTFALGTRLCTLRIVALGTRRGPAPEARALYDDLSPPVEPDLSKPKPAQGGRPDKHTRRRFAAPSPSALD